VVHQEALRATLVEVLRRFLEERVDSKLKFGLFRTERSRIFG